MKKPGCCDVDHARRSFLLNAGAGIGALSLLDLFGGTAAAQPAVEAMNAGVLGAGQIPARAKRVIMLHMLGAISPRGHVRLQADAREDDGSGSAAVRSR